MLPISRSIRPSFVMKMSKLGRDLSFKSILEWVTLALNRAFRHSNHHGRIVCRYFPQNPTNTISTSWRKIRPLVFEHVFFLPSGSPSPTQNKLKDVFNHHGDGYRTTVQFVCIPLYDVPHKLEQSNPLFKSQGRPPLIPTGLQRIFRGGRGK